MASIRYVEPIVVIILEKEIVAHSSILAWRIPWREEPGRATVHGVAKSQTALTQLNTHAYIVIITMFLLTYCCY